MAQDGKGLSPEANEKIREIIRPMLVSKTQIQVAEDLRIEQGFLSDFMRGRRGAGVKLIAGLVNLRPDLAPTLLTLRRRKGDPIDLPRAPVVSEETERSARRIMAKRGWAEDEIDAGKRRSRVTTQADADDPIAVADAWELPLLGRQREPRSAPR